MQKPLPTIPFPPIEEESSMNFSDLFRRRDAALHWLNATQFLGGLNDSLFRMSVLIFLLGLNPASTDLMLSATTSIFALPFLLVAPFAGFLADRYSKSRLATLLKDAELVIMLLALPALAFRSAWLLYVFLLLMALQSALFQPVKEAMVPELVKDESLGSANGKIIFYFTLSGLFGIIVAPMLSGIGRSSGLGTFGILLPQFVCVLLALIGVFTSRRLWRVPAASPDLHPDFLLVRQWLNTYRWIRTQRMLSLAMLATVVFSMVVTFSQLNIISFAAARYRLGAEASVALAIFFSVGISLGALGSGHLSKRDPDIGVMPIGTTLFSVGVLLLGLLSPVLSVWLSGILLFAAGFGVGLFLVPFMTFLQWRLPMERRGEGFSFQSYCSWAGAILGALFFGGWSSMGVSPAVRFVLIALFSFLLSIGVFHTLRDFCVRMLVTFFVRLFYRVRTIGLENVPLEGPAMLIANHASYTDALLLGTTTHRRIRFMMSSAVLEKLQRYWFCRIVLRQYDVIPIHETDSPRKIAASLLDARKALHEGYLVCVFPEGGITRTGTIRAFKRGFEQIARNTKVPIIPIYMGGSWGTMYSYYSGRLLKRWWRGLFLRYPVTILFGKPLPTDTPAFRVRNAVMELSCDYFNARKDEHRSVAEAVVSVCRSNFRRPFCDDTSGMSFTWGKLLIASLILARALRKRTHSQAHIGILLPACCPNVLCNLAVALLGKCTVNLNFTIGKQAFASAIQQCDIRTILTSKKFVERFPDLPVPEGSYVFLEDLMNGVTKRQKISAALAAIFLPYRWMVASDRTAPDSLSTIIFSSGSTGEPKGVMLSQHNILSEVESLRMLLATSREDHITAALPFFHSFGLMGCLWYPLLTNVRVTYHTNPLDSPVIIDIIRTKASTMIWGTPTFLSLYLRRATKDDFKTLKIVLAGGEKLKQSLIDAYVEKFGIRPLEAYGATELSPGIAVSVPNGTGGGVVQAGYKDGRTGLPCAGIAMKVLDPDTGEELGPNRSGLLYLRGPNVMLGYFGRKDLTDEVIKNGWYCTGDIAFIDEDGFVALTDRLSRFSKIGGEMVPHVGVEEAFVKGAKLPENALAVTGVPDDRKGEKLVVLFTKECGTAEHLQHVIAEMDLPNLWRPAPADYHLVDHIPLLGTGKLDLAGIKRLALEVMENGVKAGDV